MTRWIPLAFALIGCTGATGTYDRDGDGLSDADERLQGTDPDDPDTDGDTLDDGAEVWIWHTDPLDAYTDDDRYRDGDEVFEGSDPLSKKDRIYKGRWPYFRDKDALGTKRMSADRVEDGKKFPRFQAIDQFGDEVDLYDFAHPASGAELIVLQLDWFW